MSFRGSSRETTFFNFLDKATPQQKHKFGLFMWFALYFGYFVFCLNWLVFSGLKGDDTSGWASAFKDHGLGSDQNTRAIRLDAVNFSITFARGLITVAVAWIMTKLSHKRASSIALFLNTAALPLIFSPHYAVLVVGRMFMAAGGTMLIILLQPVISRFFGLKMKGVLSALTPTAYIFAGLLSNLIFVYSDKNSWIDVLNKNWKYITAGFAALSYLPFLSYLYWGRNFLYSERSMENEIIDRLPENTYTGIIKEKSTWLWFFWYSFLLVNSLLVSWKAPVIIKAINQNLVTNTLGSSADWSKIYLCIFYLGCLLGMIWGRWAKTQYQRKPVVVLCCFLSLVFWLLILAFAHIPNNTAATVLIYMTIFLFAFFAIGIQSVILYIPHEYQENHNAKRITIFYSYIWGLGYIVYTVYQILVVSCLPSGDTANGGSKHPYIAALLITLFVALFFILSLFIKEPRPNYKFFPGLNQMSDLWKRKRSYYIE